MEKSSSPIPGPLALIELRQPPLPEKSLEAWIADTEHVAGWQLLGKPKARDKLFIEQRL